MGGGPKKVPRQRVAVVAVAVAVAAAAAGGGGVVVVHYHFRTFFHLLKASFIKASKRDAKRVF